MRRGPTSQSKDAFRDLKLRVFGTSHYSPGGNVDALKRLIQLAPTNTSIFNLLYHDNVIVSVDGWPVEFWQHLIALVRADDSPNKLRDLHFTGNLYKRIPPFTSIYRTPPAPMRMQRWITTLNPPWPDWRDVCKNDVDSAARVAVCVSSAVRAFAFAAVMQRHVRAFHTRAFFKS